MTTRINNTGSILIMVIASFTTLLFVQACTSSTKDQADNEEIETVVVEEEYWLIGEHSMNDIPLTSMAETETKTSSADETPAPAAASIDEAVDEDLTEEGDEVDAEIEAETDAELEEAYEIAMADELEADLLEAEYEAENTFVVTEAAVPLDETQTVVAYNKKGEQTSAIQVVSSPDGEVEQVIFIDKKHSDVYDVSAGMSGKEVKQLRKELKHMVKKNQVFLYNEESNIMYLTDIQNMAGDEITEEDIENSQVTAVVWKDKKHHKKDKN